MARRFQGRFRIDDIIGSIDDPNRVPDKGDSNYPGVLGKMDGRYYSEKGFQQE